MEDDGYFYTRSVIENGPPLEEKVRRKGERKVTLIELINAFEEVRNEINAHQENIEEEIKIILGRLSKLNGRAMPITEICDVRNKEELVMTISSLLFLAREDKITMWQEDFPYGMIYIKKVHHHAKK